MNRRTPIAIRTAVVALTALALLAPTAARASDPSPGKQPAIGKVPVAKPRASQLKKFVPEHGQRAASNAAAAWKRAQTSNAAALKEQSSMAALAATAPATAPTKINGDVSATPLAPSSTWTAGGASGSFNWSYPITVVPTAAGPAPSLAVSYSSGSVDGRLPSTNNQPSGLGEGFDLTQSYVERSYGSCEDDGHDLKFDRCWNGDQVSIVLNGQSNRLVKVDDTTYRLESDDASRVEHKTGNDVNGDDNGEYWVVTTTNGTQYVFGKHKLPGAGADAPVTNSVWTVPVFGDDPGEPCYDAGGFGQSWCTQAWKWNLDYVVDLHGNAATYWYNTEHNNYAKNGDATPGTDYVRGGYLKRIDYGLRKDALFDNDAQGVPNVVHESPQSVVLTWGERCLQAAPDCDVLKKETKDYWPDVPFDSICKDGDACTGQGSPSFFTRKLLNRITTKVSTSSGYQDVDSWDFDHLFLDAGEVGDTTDQTLWLSSITRTGLVGGTVATEPVKFTPIMLENRVDGGSDDILPLGKPRLYTITSETGAVTSVAYSEPDCWAGNSQVPARLPSAADSNRMRCFPSYWSPNGERTPKKDWFQKYVVLGVDQADPAGGAPDLVTRYVYGDGDSTSDDAAWHYSARALTPKREQTWSEWRGYEEVTTLVGDPGREPVRSKTVEIYLRGMDGDQNAGSDPPKNVSVTGINAPAIADSDQYSGFKREEVQYDGLAEDGSTGPLVSGTVYDPWSLSKASQTFPADTVDGTTYPSVTVRSWMVRTKSSTTRTRVSSGAAYDRLSVSDTTYDTSYGMPTQIDSYTVPNASAPGTRKDQTCERTWYARNPAIGLLDPVARTQIVAVPCSSTPSLPATSATTGDVVSDAANLYDGSTMTSPSAWSTQSPSAGDETYLGRPTGYSGGSPSGWQKVKTSTYDALGRPLDVLDAMDNKTSTTYVPAGAGVAVSKSERNALLQTPTVTRFDQNRGQIVSVTDKNNKLTETTFDPLGRVTAVWTPITSRALGSPAAVTYAYHLGRRISETSTDETWVSTSTLIGNSDQYRTTYTFYDALLRELQTQIPSPAGGRVITETSYDSRGLAAEKYADVYDPAQAPTGDRQGIVYGRAPSQTETTYDGAQRPVLARLLVGGVEVQRTGTEYTGDSVAVTPPAGGTATREFVDELGRPSERREYDGTSPTGSGYRRTLLKYLPSGRLDRVTGPDDTVWSYGYDLFGRAVTTSDPDKGTSTSTFTVLDQVDTTRDARGTVLLYDYDKVGRRTAEYATSRTAANKQAEWQFDGVSGAVGYPSASIRYTGGLAYTRKVTSYDPMYHPKGSQLILPSTDPLVASGAMTATTSLSAAYNRDGTPQASVEPAVAGLPSESVGVTYNSAGLPTSMQGTTGYVLDTIYDAVGQPLQLSLGVSSTAANKAYLTTDFEAGTHRLLRSGVTDTVHPWMAQDLHYSYTAGGKVAGISDPTTLGGTQAADFQCFTYDGYGELAHAWTPKTDDCAAAGRTTANLSTGPAAYWNTFGYTVGGMRDTLTVHRTTGDTVTKYNYATTACAGSSSRKHVLSSSVTTPPGGTAGTATYGCDQVGNTTSRPGPAKQQTLTWDNENNLGRVVEATTTPTDTSYLYDADGELLIRRPTANGAGETVVYLGATEVHSTKATATATPVVTGLRYYTVAGRTVAVRSATKGVAGSKLSYLFADAHGTSSVALDATTMGVTKRFLAPFGGKRSGSWVDDKGFLGKSADAGTGLTHVGAREYDPALGRFVSGDPVLDTTDGQSLNGYAYADNDPLGKSDPTGTMLLDPGGGGGGEVIPWWQAWTPRHDTAVHLTAAYLSFGFGSWLGSFGLNKVTTTRKDNRIAGGSRVNPGDENGYADMIVWSASKVEVYEFKHDGPIQKDAPKQVANYVEHLRIQLRKRNPPDLRTVEAGSDIPGVLQGPNEANPSELISTWSKPGVRGVRLYNVRKAPPVAQPKANEEGEEQQHEHHGFNLLKAGGLFGLATVLVAATVVEDVGTGGFGLLDDPASLGGAGVLYRSAFTLAS